MNLEEAILARVRRLPPSSQEEVLRFAADLDRRTENALPPSQDRAREMKWIADHRADYANQWVAVEADRLVAAGTDALEVFADAKAEGIRTPFVVHILREDPYPFIPGW